MWMTLFVPLALGQEPEPRATPAPVEEPEPHALPGPVDLDGDGQRETFVDTGGAILLNGDRMLCSFDAFRCSVEVVDLRSGDGHQELVICSPGGRDRDVCELYAMREGELKRITIPPKHGLSEYPHAISVNGGGIVLADDWEPIYVKRHKLLASKDGLSLTYVPQPFYAVGVTRHVYETFPITTEPGGGAVVANVRPGSDIQIVLESGEHPTYALVHISSGLVGWVSWGELGAACQFILGAG